MLTRAAERLYTARFELGMFDTDTALSKVGPAEIASDAHRATALKVAEESLVLLKNDGALPLAGGRARSIAVVGPTADLLVSLEGNYNGQPLHPVTPLEGIVKQFGAASVHYAQGSLLAEGAETPVPRSALPGGVRAEYFATADWTGVPVAVETVPTIQTDWDSALPTPEVETHNYSVRWSGKLQAPAAGQYTFVLEPQSGFPYSPRAVVPLRS